MTCTRAQNYTNVVVGELGFQTLEIAVVVILLLLLSFDAFVPISAHPLSFLDKWFVQIYQNGQISQIRLHGDVNLSFSLYYSTNSSKRISNFPTVLNLKWLFLKLNHLICN